MPIVVQQNQPSASTASTQGRNADYILESFVRECGDRPPDGVLALRWLEGRYRQIWASAPWQFARKENYFQSVDDITSDSVTVTNASATVTETTSDSKWTSVVIGRGFRKTGDNEFYLIDGYSNDNPDILTLHTNYVGSTATVSGYRIFQNVYSLANDVGQLRKIVDLTTGRELTETNVQWLDSIYPYRPSPGVPRYYAPLGRDSNDIAQVELYPIPDAVRQYWYSYIQEAPYVTGGEGKLVPQVFEPLLRVGWLADYWSWRSRQRDATGQELAHMGTNELYFSKMLNEMVVREAQNLPPSKLQLASRYTAHRILRANKFAGRHSSDELP